jgi:hypothetical protein
MIAKTLDANALAVGQLVGTPSSDFSAVSPDDLDFLSFSAIYLCQPLRILW